MSGDTLEFDLVWHFPGLSGYMQAKT